MQVYFLAAFCFVALPLAAQHSLPGVEERVHHTHYRIRPAAATSAAGAMTPAQVTTAYGFTQVANRGKGQTIALVDAYDHPGIEADLAVFSTQFGLSACTTANGCFQKVYETGVAPATNRNWSVEIALDVEWAHAIAPDAKILLVEANSSYSSDLFRAIDIAVTQGASVVSLSFGGGEFNGDSFYDRHFNVKNVVFTVASGDAGHGVEYPASSSMVVGVGGTTLSLANGVVTEAAWHGSGGGESRWTLEPSFQTSVQQTGVRGVPDVAYNADPNTGYAVYDSLYGGWLQVGGTSAGAPQWAALFAIANSMRAATYPPKMPLSVVGTDLYRIASMTDYRDITTGTDGVCGPICGAGPGYDYVTGLGSPRANLLIPALVAVP